MTSSDLDHILNHRSLKKSRGRWRLAAVVLVLAILAAWATPAWRDGFRGDHIARVRIDGLITGDQKLIDTLAAIAEDNKAKTVILRINSPGGTTAGSEALFEAVRDLAAKKPVVAVMDTVAASGGYIAALAADRIVARGNTITGSIGVIFTFPEVSQLLETLGIRIEEIKSGELKAEPSPYKPVSERAREVSAAMVADGLVWFRGLVTERRKLTPARTIALSDGRVFTGRQALTEGLIDAIGGEDEAIAWLESQNKLKADLPIHERRPDQGFAGGYLGEAAMKLLAGKTGLEALRSFAERARLDGMLVLWHPDL